jgi:hypothetical protein
MSDELLNEEEQFLALLEEEAKELAEKEQEALATEELAPVVEKIVEPKKPVEEKPEKVEKSSKKVTNEKTVALLSTRNVSWTGVGTVEVGYNIVTEEQAEKWLTRSHITLATPEDVAKGYGL